MAAVTPICGRRLRHVREGRGEAEAAAEGRLSPPTSLWLPARSLWMPVSTSIKQKPSSWARGGRSAHHAGKLSSWEELAIPTKFWWRESHLLSKPSCSGNPEPGVCVHRLSLTDLLVCKPRRRPELESGPLPEHGMGCQALLPSHLDAHGHLETPKPKPNSLSPPHPRSWRGRCRRIQAAAPGASGGGVSSPVHSAWLRPGEPRPECDSNVPVHPTVQGITFVRAAGSHVKPAVPLRAERASGNPKPDLHLSAHRDLCWEPRPRSATLAL